MYGIMPLALQDDAVHRRMIGMARTATMTVRIEEELKQALEKAAADDERTLSQYVERALVAHLRKAGYWPPR
jgi:predicted HicB family RNase H-like nuclease